jgi:hypothetical protein
MALLARRISDRCQPTSPRFSDGRSSRLMTQDRTHTQGSILSSLHSATAHSGQCTDGHGRCAPTRLRISGKDHGAAYISIIVVSMTTWAVLYRMMTNDVCECTMSLECTQRTLTFEPIVACSITTLLRVTCYSIRLSRKVTRADTSNRTTRSPPSPTHGKTRNSAHTCTRCLSLVVAFPSGRRQHGRGLR